MLKELVILIGMKETKKYIPGIKKVFGRNILEKNFIINCGRI
jgi:hypothetical protein